MAAPQEGNGVEVRPNSVRLFFVWEGVRYRETLTVAGKPVKPTSPNIAHANRTAIAIRKAIALGTFKLADFFPDSPRAAEKSADRQTFGEACGEYLATKGRLAEKTKNQYRNALGVWMGLLGADTPIARITHGKIASVVGSTPWASAKLLNNYLIPLRGVFKLAARDLRIEDAVDGIENSKHQAAPPDPLTRSEAASILADMRDRYDPRIHAYYLFAFATGLRPEEQIALRWSDIDWNHKTAMVQRARTSGVDKPLKTYTVRNVDLTTDAVAALRAMKPWTFLAQNSDPEVPVFQNPVTNRPFHDDRSQRDHYWTPTLRRLGIRQRRAYQTRHTYATLALMAGANPAYVSRQMGHKTAQMLFNVYSKWIDGADKGRERAKLEAAQVGGLTGAGPAANDGGHQADGTTGGA